MLSTEAYYRGVDRAIEAKFEEVKERKNQLATLDNVQLYRHELKKETVNPEIERIATELQLDKELGLKNQAEITAESALQHDIDELTASNDYVQVSIALLERLFSIGKLRGECLWHNIKSMVGGFIRASATSLILLSIIAVTVYPLCLFSSHVYRSSPETLSLLLLGLLCAGFWIGELIFMIAAIGGWVSGFKMKYESLNVKLDCNPLRQVSIRIPYGAKLKVQEAKKTGIFEDFVLVRPLFTVEQKEFVRQPIDPAILGITKDNRMFMIVYWDMQNDTEKVFKEIRQFKKYKLNA